MQTGTKCKSSYVIELARDCGEKVFSDIYPSKVDMRGKKQAQTIGGKTDAHSRVHGRFRPIWEQVCQALPFGGWPFQEVYMQSRPFGVLRKLGRSPSLLRVISQESLAR